MQSSPRCILVGALLLLCGTSAPAQYVPAELPLEKLPTEHAYQKTLRAYLAGLTEKDLAVERKKFTVAATTEPEEQYRLWLLTLHLPAVAAAGLPASAFTLEALERRKGLALPAAPNQSQMLAWLAAWDYPGNPYRGNAALKRRAFVLAAVDVVMLDYLYEHNPGGWARSDFLGGNLIWLGYTLKHVKDVLPAKVRAALETGLKKHVARLRRWGPTGRMTDMDLFAPVGLAYLAQAIDDAELKREAAAYARRLFTEERFFHPAGYFVDVGCFDTSYNGISLYFAAHAALVGEWKFAREAVDRAYRLRAHLSLPDPDGVCFGPSHMSSRTSADSPHDQWNFPHRPHATALLTDEALHLAPLPTAEQMKAAPARIVAHLEAQLKRSAVVKPQPWRESHWSGHLNFAYEHYRKGYYTRRLRLEKEGSPLLQPLYRRQERFVREFAGAFVIGRFDGYAAVIHTGPIRGWPNGLGGGMLSAFWTPKAGPALLGRRRGMQGPVVDRREEWRSWPVHALSGTLHGGQLITSADVARPRVSTRIKDQGGEVRIEGQVPAGKLGGLAYQRRFVLGPKGLTIHSTVKLPDRVKPAELYETIPVFLNDGARVAGTKARIQWQVGERWLDATERPQADVKAVRVERYGGGVLIVLDRPRRVSLSAKEWVDGYQSRATCRTVLIDVLEGRRAGEAVNVRCTVAPAP